MKKYGAIRDDLQFGLPAALPSKIHASDLQASGFEKELDEVRRQIADLPGVAIEHSEEQRAILRCSSAGAPPLRLLVSYPTQSSGIPQFQLVPDSGEAQNGLNRIALSLAQYAREVLERDRTCLAACVWQLLQFVKSDAWRRRFRIGSSGGTAAAPGEPADGWSTTVFPMDVVLPQMEIKQDPPWTRSRVLSAGPMPSTDGGVEGGRPCPRFEGAVFSGSGLLVRFSSFSPARNRLGQISVPRTLADLRAARHGNRRVGRGHVSEATPTDGAASNAPLRLAEVTETDAFSWHFDLASADGGGDASSTVDRAASTPVVRPAVATAPTRRSKQSLTRRRLQQSGRGGGVPSGDGSQPGLQLRRPLLLSVVDFSFLLPARRELAHTYALGPRSGRRALRALAQGGTDVRGGDPPRLLHELCTLNMKAARLARRNDLVQLWSLLGIAFCGAVEESSLASISGPWSEHPCRTTLVEQLFDRYELLGDVQTLATVACVLYSLGARWVARDADRYLFAYADVLHRWGLFGKRAEILKFVRGSNTARKREPLRAEEDAKAVGGDALDFSPFCWRCLQPCEGSVCADCASFGLAMRCAVCDVGVRGMVFVCGLCGHGGHARHMRSWFESNVMCPTGCGCECRGAPGRQEVR